MKAIHLGDHETDCPVCVALCSCEECVDKFDERNKKWQDNLMLSFILFIIFVLPILFLLGLSFLSGWNGYQNDNGFSDFVNSARWMDGK